MTSSVSESPLPASRRGATPPRPPPASFLSDVRTYVGRVREFDRADWIVYAAWVGLMVGLTLTTLAFVALGAARGAPVPRIAWLLPVGAATFTVAIAIDTIGHRTVYKPVLARAEGLVHAVTIFCGVASCVLLCASYGAGRDAFFIPATVLTVLSFVYSLVDEAFHWHRYWSASSDRVEMWSHVGILVGHGTMMAAWWTWCFTGYAGVAETLARI
jgi:hypothetical protein